MPALELTRRVAAFPTIFGSRRAGVCSEVECLTGASRRLTKASSRSTIRFNRRIFVWLANDGLRSIFVQSLRGATVRLYNGRTSCGYAERNQRSTRGRYVTQGGHMGSVLRSGATVQPYYHHALIENRRVGGSVVKSDDLTGASV